MQRYEHAEATATPDTTVESTWGSQMPPLPPVLPGLVLHDGYLEDESLEMPEDPLDRQEISGFIRDLVRGRTLPVLAVNGTAVECCVAMDKQLRYMVIQRTGKKEAKRRALALETVDQVCIGQEAMEESGLPLTELCVCLLLTEGQAVAFVLQNTMVNALEQQAELSDLKRQLDGATAQGRRQEHRLRQHRTSLRELIRQLEEVEERVDGVQRRVDTVSKSIHRSAEAVGVQERRAQQLDQLANSSALKRGASAALAHGSPDAKTNKASRLDMKIDDKLEELERRLWHATQDFDRRLVEEAERRAAAQEEVLGVLGQGVQQMRSEQARHASELNDNLRAEQRRWRQCISDAQAQQDEQQKHIEGLEARLDAAVEALSLEYQSMRAALPKLQHAGTSPRDRSHKHHEVPSKGQEAPTKGHDVAVKGHEHGGCGAAVTVVTQGEASNSVAPEHFRAVHDETRLHTNHHHPNPDILIRLEALEGRYRDTRGQASVENSPRARVEVTNPPDAHSGTGMWSSQTMTSPNALNNPPNGLPQGLGLTPPAGLTVEPMRLAHAHLPTVPAVSTTPEPPWQHAKPQLAPSWLDARPSSSQSVSPRSPKHNDELFELQAHRMDVSARYPGQSLQAQPEVQKPKPHSAQPRQSLSPDSPALPWSPIGGTLAPKAVSNKPSGRDQSSPNSPSPNLGRNTPPLEPPMPHPSYPQPARLPAPPPGGSMTWECFA